MYYFLWIAGSAGDSAECIRLSASAGLMPGKQADIAAPATKIRPSDEATKLRRNGRSSMMLGCVGSELLTTCARGGFVMFVAMVTTLVAQ